MPLSHYFPKIATISYLTTGNMASLVAQMVKNLPAMHETWVRKIPWRREWLTTTVFLPGEFHGHRDCQAIVHGVEKSWTQVRD